MTGADAPFVLPLSADAPELLVDLRGACAAFLRARAALRPGDVLRTAERRRARPWRAVAVGETATELADALEEDGSHGRLVSGAAPAGEQPPRVAWLLTDPQRPVADVVRRLHERIAPLRDALDACSTQVLDHWGIDVWATLTGDGAPAASGERVALTALQLAAVAAWRGCAPAPQLVAGHGLGTVAALHAAGALSSADALHLAAVDGLLAGERPDALAAVAAELDVRPLAIALRFGDGQAGVAAAGTTVELGAVLHEGVVAPASWFGADSLDCVADVGFGTASGTVRADLLDGVQWIAVADGDGAPLGGLVHALAHAYCAGVAIEFGGLFPALDGRIVPLPAPPLQRQRVWPGTSAGPEPAQAARPDVAEQHEAAGAAQPAVVDAIAAAILDHAGSELGLSAAELQADRSFFDLGADSLAMVNVLRRVEDAFGVSVSMRELFEDGDSPAALARLIASRLDRTDDPVDPPANPSPPPAPAPADPLPRGHGPRFVPDSHSASITARQREHLERLVADFTGRTPASKRLAERFRHRLADCRASIGFRPHTKEMLYPIAARSAAAAHIEDIDGNDYVDIAMGFGVLLFGHDPPFLRDAVARHLANGMRLVARGEDTGVAAELLCELTGMDRVAFTTSGTEAVSAALRIARAATGRDKVAMFQGSYHGHIDSVLARDSGRPPVGSTTVPVSIGIPAAAIADTLVLDYDERALEAIAAHGDQLAAVLVEPVQSRFPDRRPRAFLQQLRALTEERGILLVFDEMLTGLRPHPGGAQAIFGVRADLATYGKALGGGHPIGAVAGRGELLDLVDGGAWRYGDASRPERETTFVAGTYMQHPLAMAAARATLTHLRDAGPSLQERLNARTAGLAERLNAFCAEQEHPLRVLHFGSLFRFALQRDLELLFPHLMTKGVFVWEHRNFFLSTAHTDEDVAHVEQAVRASLAAMRDGGWSPAPTPRPAPVPQRRKPRFSVYYFGNYPRETEGADRYELLFETARFADAAGFHALWVPERHFHAFGGIFPNPSVVAAALARETHRIRLHAGSVVLPLHDPIRVAEEWAVVDNLSNGRVGLGVASGWHANDFALRPDMFGRHKDAMYEALATVRALWRGEAVEARSGTGEPIAVRLHPPPVQAEPPLFTAILGNPESYERAGRHGLGVITNLMAQDVDELAANIARYRAARAGAGLDPAAGSVVLLLHTFLRETQEAARREAFAPLCAYLRSSLSLFGQVANSLGMNIDLERTSETDVTYLLGRAYERYCDTRALIGTVTSCGRIVERVVAAGVDEIACFVDFGMSLEQVRRSLPEMAKLRERFAADDAAVVAPRPPSWELEGAPVAFAQERMWFTERLHEGVCVHNEPRAIRLAGALDAVALEAALADVVREEPTLRCCIREHDDAPTQWVHRDVDVSLPVVDVAGEDEDAVVAAQMRHESEQAFDLAEGPLWRGRLLRFEREHYVLVFTFHHIIFDTASARSFARRLAQTYAARLRGVEPAARSARPSYLDYVRAQRAQVDEAAVQTALERWRERLTPLPAPLALPTDRTRPERWDGRGGSIFRRLGPEVARRVEAASAAARVTTSMFLTAVFACALRALSGQSEIVMGTAVSDRPIEHDEALGLYLNTLVLRLDLDGASMFATALDRVRAVLLDAHEHARAPFEEVVRRVNPPREAGRNPLFQTSIQFDTDRIYDFQLEGIEANELTIAPSKSTFDLTLFVHTDEKGVDCQFEYATALFDRETVEDLASAFETILEAAVVDRDSMPAAALATAADADARLAHFEHGPPLAAGQRDPIVARVREHARRDPARVAIEAADGTSISYGVLAERVEQLAGLLALRGVQPGVAVMLDLPQQPSLAVAMLAALAVGGAYAPVDVRTPDERKALISMSCAPAVVVCDVGAATPWWTSGTRVELDASGALLEQPATPPGVPARPVDPNRPGYILHTSGSTGRPKSVVMPVAGLESLASWHAEVHPPARTLQYASPGFDVCTQEVVCTLANGGTVVMIAPETRYDGAALARALIERRVEQLHIPVTPLRRLLEALGDSVVPDLRELLVAGEQLLLTDQLRHFMRRNPHLAVWNEYGPTETHAATRHRVALHDDVRVPIGTPVPRMIVRLLEPGTLRRVPIGAIGEVCVAGAQVATGYGPGGGGGGAFIADPWDDRPAARMYRTGDLGRWRHDGRLVFVGRLDDQIKIRGNRVEPGEVQAMLTALPLVADAAVLPTVDRQGEPTLAAYVVPAEAALALDDRALLSDLRAGVARQLPEYMVPAAWALLTHLPVNASNKLDRDALPTPQFGDPHANGEPPASAVEAVVRELWCAELGLDDAVGATTSFFEVGGHSLNAVCVVNRVNAHFGVELPMLDFFRAPTVRATAEAVERLVAAR